VAPYVSSGGENNRRNVNGNAATAVGVGGVSGVSNVLSGTGGGNRPMTLAAAAAAGVPQRHWSEGGLTSHGLGMASDGGLTSHGPGVGTGGGDGSLRVVHGDVLNAAAAAPLGNAAAGGVGVRSSPAEAGDGGRPETPAAAV
jgi:hypothetical protein